jgi:hypothetical protein
VLERGSFTYFAAITTTTTNSRKCFRKLHRCIENQIKVENIGLSLTNIWNSKPIHEFSKKHCASTFAYNNNKNCLGSFQVLWNKNCTTENEEIMMEK